MTSLQLSVVHWDSPRTCWGKRHRHCQISCTVEAFWGEWNHTSPSTKDGPWILHDLTNPKQKEHQITRRYGFLRQIQLNQSIVYQLHSKWSVFSFKDYIYTYIYIYPDPKKRVIEWKCTYSHNFPFPAAIQIEGKLWRSWRMITGFGDVSRARNR